MKKPSLIVGLNISSVVLPLVFNKYDPYYYYGSQIEKYMISLKWAFKGQAIRFGISANFNNNKGADNDSIKNSYKQNTVYLGFGYEKYRCLGKGFMLYYGIDGIFSQYNSVNKYNSTVYSSREYSSKTYNYGVSPVLGILFNINHYLSFSTEMSYDAIFTKSTSKSLTNPSSSNDHTTTNNGFSTTFNAPTSLILQIRLN